MMFAESPTAGLLAGREGWADAHPQDHADAGDAGIRFFGSVLRAGFLADAGDDPVLGAAPGEEFPLGADPQCQSHCCALAVGVAVDREPGPVAGRWVGPAAHGAGAADPQDPDRRT